MSLSALRWLKLQWCCAGWGAAEGELVGIVHSYVLCTLYVDGCVCKEATSLYIVLQVSSELYIVPTNIYSCHSSTVRRRHLHCIDHGITVKSTGTLDAVCVIGRRTVVDGEL